VRFVSFRWRTVDCLAPLSLAVSPESLIREVERAPEPAGRSPVFIWCSLMPICPMFHSKWTRDLDVHPSILPDSIWRCDACGDAWNEHGAGRPKPDPTHFVETDTHRRRKTDAIWPPLH
jgi:hypothetical protein